MRFHKPFDDAQWQAATQTHAQMRTNLAKLRRRFSPRTPEEDRLLREYRNVIQEFGRELLKPDAKIRPDRLNALGADATESFLAYVRFYGLRGH